MAPFCFLKLAEAHFFFTCSSWTIGRIQFFKKLNLLLHGWSFNPILLKWTLSFKKLKCKKLFEKVRLRTKRAVISLLLSKMETVNLNLFSLSRWSKIGNSSQWSWTVSSCGCSSWPVLPERPPLSWKRHHSTIQRFHWTANLTSTSVLWAKFPIKSSSY